MKDFIRKILGILDSLDVSGDKREFVIKLSEELFDEYFVPIDLPGPDSVIDPLLRASIRPVVGRIFDEILKNLEK